MMQAQKMTQSQQNDAITAIAVTPAPPLPCCIYSIGLVCCNISTAASMLQSQHRAPMLHLQHPKHRNTCWFHSIGPVGILHLQHRSCYDAITASGRFAVISASKPSIASCCNYSIIVRRAWVWGPHC